MRTFFGTTAFLNRLGFTLTVLLVFVAGIFWERYSRDSEFRLPAAHQADPDWEPAQQRFGVLEAEPEDYYPVAEFREQAGMLVGCFELIQKHPALILDIVRAVDGRTPLFGLVDSPAQKRQGRELLRRAGLHPESLLFIDVPIRSIWVRDYAPFFIRRLDNSVVMVDAEYANGSSFPLRGHDNELPAILGRMLDLPIRSVPFSIEGGNLLSNGDGYAVTSIRFLQQNQEFEYTQGQLLSMLNKELGVETWAYLMHLAEEPTGHVDMFMTFLAKNIAVVAEVDPEKDPDNAGILNRAADILASRSTSVGPMKVFRIPMPDKWNANWRSYTNIAMLNGLLLMPSFSDVDPALEDKAEALYRSLRPGWEVKRINCDSLVKRGGLLHCMTCNIPKYVSLEGLHARARADLVKGNFQQRKL